MPVEYVEDADARVAERVVHGPRERGVVECLRYFVAEKENLMPPSL